MSDTAPDPIREELRTTIQALSAAIQALTQATQVLHGTANLMVQAVQGSGAGGGAGAGAGGAVDAGVAQARINVWEDDPFSESVPTLNPPVTQTIAENVPAAPPQNLRWQITEPRPAPAQYVPGTAEFRFWNAEATMARGVGFWGPALPQGTRWSTFAQVLPVTLIAGQSLNARYRRLDGLGFFQQVVGGVRLFSGESPDVICHELGHAILDALRPELFDAASTEADAFHEAIGDVSAMLVALQVPSMRQRILNETQGRLNVSSRLSRVAEQLGWGIRQLSRDAVDRDSLRNAANRFFYRSPDSLPPEAPAAQLSTEPHSFARVFTGAFLDALAGMASINGAPDDAGLETVSRDMRQLLVDGILTAPVTPAYFSQVAAAMVQAARVRQNGRYRAVLLRAFVERGILGLEAAGNLDVADVPVITPTPPMTDAARGVAGMLGEFAYMSGSPSLLSFGANVSTGFLADARTAPDLPLMSVTAEFLRAPILCHAPDERERFSVAPATLGMNPAPGSDAMSAARHFIEDLIQLGRIDPGPATGIVADLNVSSRGNHTHKLEQTSQGLVLKRIHFDCRFCRH